MHGNYRRGRFRPGGKNAWLAEKARRENKGRTAYSRGLRHCPKPHLRRTGVSCDDATRATGFIHIGEALSDDFVLPFGTSECLRIRWIWKNLMRLPQKIVGPSNMAIA